MAKIRFGYSDDFTAKNSGVGINTTDPQTNLDVVGVVKGQDLKVTGVSSQTGYEGFLRADHQIEENTQLNFGQGVNSSLSGEIIVGTGQTVTVNEVVKEDRFGPELLTNTDFSDNTNNWTANGATLPTLSSDSDRLKIVHNGANGGAYQNITTVVGGTYIFTAYLSNGNATSVRLRVYGDGASGDGFQGTNYIGDSISSTSSTLAQIVIDAETTTTRVYVEVLGTNAEYAFAHSVHAKRVNDVEEPGTNVAGGSQVECMKVYNTFTPPSGDTNQRPSKPKPGQLYYNYDFKTIEFHDGYGWRQVDNTTRSGRGVFAGGASPSEHTTIDFVTIPTLGNAQSFGDLVTATQRCGACASSTRGLIGGGGFPNETNVIQYITIASQGNSVDFGDLLGEGGNNERAETSALSSSTRGVWGGGGQYPDAATNRIDYVEIATIGNSIDFGDLTIIKDTNGAVSNGTRGLFCGGQTSSVIDAITISSKGDSIDIGDLTQARSRNAGISNSVRGVIGGGLTPIFVNTIDFVIIANNGNATDFGDLNNAVRHPGACSSQTRGLWGGGINPSNINNIDYVTIATAGNAQDFGDLTKTTFAPAGLSDSHGGLGGF